MIIVKTTLELPDRLMRKVKIRAAQTDRKLKDVVAELITRGMAEPDSPARPESADLTGYIGKWPRYRNIDELNDYMDELRRERNVAG